MIRFLHTQQASHSWPESRAMITNRILLVGATGVLLLLVVAAVGVYDKIESFYFDVANSEVSESDLRKPDYAIYVGDKVPVKSTVDWNGRELQLLHVAACCVPFLEVRTPVSLSDMIVTTGKMVSNFDSLAGTSCVHIFEKAENTYLISWIYWPEESRQATCIRIGDEVGIEFVPSDGTESLVLSAVLVRSGYYWQPHLW